MSGSDDGSVALWSTMKKKPMFLAHGAHGDTQRHLLSEYTANGEKPTEESSTSALSNGNTNGNCHNFHPTSCCAASHLVPYTLVDGVFRQCYFSSDTVSRLTFVFLTGTNALC